MGCSAIRAAAVAAAAAAVFGGCGRGGGSDEPRREPPRLLVETFAVRPEPFRETLAAHGTLRPNEAVELQSERSGLVTEIRLEEGVPANKGDVLLRIDDSELRAEYQRAEARLALERANEERQRGLLQRRGISAADYDESLANLNAALAEANLIRAQLEKTVIRAPFDGTPGLREVSVGSYLTPGTRIARFIDTESLKLDFSVPERYLPDLRPGQEIEFSVAGRNRRFVGTIYAIEPGVDVGTRSAVLRASVPNNDGALQPGQFAEIQIALDEVPDAIRIPPIALVPGLKRQIVFVLEDGKVAEREVGVGIRGSDAVQITEGLADGDLVITSGVLQLRPGMAVDVAGRETPD